MRDCIHIRFHPTNWTCKAQKDVDRSKHLKGPKKLIFKHSFHKSRIFSPDIHKMVHPLRSWKYQQFWLQSERCIPGFQVMACSSSGSWKNNLKRVSAEAKGGFRMFEVAAILSTQHHPSAKKFQELWYILKIFERYIIEVNRLQTSLSSKPNPPNDHPGKLPEQTLFAKYLLKYQIISKSYSHMANF